MKGIPTTAGNAGSTLRATVVAVGLVIAALGLWLTGGMAEAADFTTGTSGPVGIWANTNGGTYTIAGNWLNSQTPNASGTAIFPSNATYQVDFPASVTNRAADFEAAGGKVTLNIGAGNLWALTNAFSLGTNAGAFATVAVTSGALRASAGTMMLGNGVLTNSGSGVIEVGTPGVTSYPLLYVPANMTCTVGQVTIRGGNTDNTWSSGGPGALILNTAFANPDLTGTKLNGGGYGSHFTVSNGTIKAGAANVLGLPSRSIGGILTISNATLDMNGYDQTISSQNSGYIAANAALVSSRANATWHVLGNMTIDGLVTTNATGGLVSFETFFSKVIFKHGGQTVKDLIGLPPEYAHIILYSTNSSDHNLIYGSVTPRQLIAYLCADTAGHISRTLGGKEADGTTDRSVTIGDTFGCRVYLYIKGDGGTYVSNGSFWPTVTPAQSAGGANISNGSYTNNNDYSNGTLAPPRLANEFVLARNDAYSTNVTYTMRNLLNGINVNTTNGAFKLRFQGTNTLTVNATHTVNGTLLINKVVESGRRSLTKAGTGTLTIENDSAYGATMLSAGTLIVGGTISNQIMTVSGNAELKFVGSPTAVGRLDVTGVWNNSANARLVVDLSAYTWPKGSSVTLATFASMPVPYALENITVIGDGFVIQQTATKILAQRTTGNTPIGR